MLDMIGIGNNLAKMRMKTGLTQEQLAQTLYVSHQAVSKWETGKALPSIDNLLELARLFKADLNELLCLDKSLTDESMETIFSGHERRWVIHEVVLEKVAKVHYPDIIHMLDLKEREYALHLMAEFKIMVDEILWPRLSYAERFWLINRHKAKSPIIELGKVMPLMSRAEIRKLKEEMYEDR